MKVISGILLVIFVIGTVLAQPAPPQLSEQFQANITFSETRPHYSVDGTGFWGANQPKGLSIETFILDDQHPLNRFRLLRYDLQMGYEGSFGRCESFKIDGNMSAVWSWVRLATYSQLNYKNKMYDAWSFTAGYAKLTLAVTNNIPQWLFRESPEINSTVQFNTWDATAPDSSAFTVPNNCNNLNKKTKVHSLGCVARATMIDRAEVWVKEKVPYSQTTTYQGYREDCSGYVSMAWESSKPGHTTFTLHEIAHRITKSELEEGDVLLCASEHVVLFGGWADSSKTQYVAYEETRPGEGTVKRVTPYPYWYNTACFLPYRYNSVC